MIFIGAVFMRVNFLLFILVVTNPYRNLDYSKINIYYLNGKTDSRVLVVEPEKDKNKKVTEEVLFCFLCTPPQFVPMETWQL